MNVRAASLALILAASACAHAARPVPAEAAAAARAEVRALSRDYLAAYVRWRPEDATAAGVPGADPAAVQDPSPAALAGWHAAEDRLLARALAVDPRLVAGSPEAAARAVLVEALGASRAARACRAELWDVSPVDGWPVAYAVLAGVQPVGTPALRAAAVARVSALARRVDGEIANLREGARLGYVATRENVERVAAELDRLLATPPERWPEASPAERDDDPAFRAALAEAIERDLAPAAARYRAYLRSEYVDRARRSPGLRGLPGGDACYAASLRLHTSLELDPAEVHSVARARLEAVGAELRPLAERVLGTGSVPEALRRLRSDPALRLRSADEVVAVFRDALARARAAAPRWFARVPAAPVELRPYPESLRGASPPERYTPDLSAGRLAGLVWVDALEPGRTSRALAEAAAFRVAIPGRHLQRATALEAPAPPLGAYVPEDGFVEGWALYAERLAAEGGLSSGELERMGALADEAARAARLVVDSGVAVFGWRRQRAIDYLVANAGLPEDEAAAAVDRCAARPGEAAAAVLGGLELARLRAGAEAALGPRFDLRAFHAAVLEDGAVPLPVLRARIAGWVAARAMGAR